MEYPVGVSLALGVALFGSLSRFERDRAFYPTMAIVIASYYELFSVMGGSSHALGLESVAFLGFVAIAVIGYKTNLWMAVIAIAGHGVFDIVHPHIVSNPGVPAWWPMFCMTYDVTAGLYLAYLLASSKVHVRQPAQQTFPVLTSDAP
jgi:hypothetical protein